MKHVIDYIIREHIDPLLHHPTIEWVECDNNKNNIYHVEQMDGIKETKLLVLCPWFINYKKSTYPLEEDNLWKYRWINIDFLIAVHDFVT